MVLSDEDIVRLYQDPKFFGSFSGRKLCLVLILNDFHQFGFKQISHILALGASNLRTFLYTDFGEVRCWMINFKILNTHLKLFSIARATIETLSDPKNYSKLCLQCETYS